LALASACGGESTIHHVHYLYMQKCAECHGVSPTAKAPAPNAENLLDPAHRPGYQQVRRAILDGRKGMPKGLLGDGDVDEIAAYLSSGKVK
jgi:mono/diheme cytochrome c family protein